MRIHTLSPVFTEYIPADPEPGNLYVSMQFETAVHLCACGCRARVVTPLGPHDWVLTFDGTVSLQPSIGNGQQRCRTHYYIRRDRIVWLPHISTAATQAANDRDRAAHTQAKLVQPAEPWWRFAWRRLHRPRLSARSRRKAP